MRTVFIASFAALALTSAAWAQSEHATEEGVFINKGQEKWGNAPPTMPKGAKFAVLNGDPGKPGPFTVRMSAPAGYKIPPHWHSQSENLTVITGSLYLGMGDKADGKGAHILSASGFHYLPAKQHHYAYTKVPAVIQISGDGPFDINYVDAKDNPERVSMK